MPHLDYKEPLPLGQAEWVKLVGLFIGKEQEANALFAGIEQRYTDLKDKALKAGHRPTVTSGEMHYGTWRAVAVGSLSVVPQRIRTRCLRAKIVLFSRSSKFHLVIFEQYTPHVSHVSHLWLTAKELQMADVTLEVTLTVAREKPSTNGLRHILGPQFSRKFHALYATEWIFYESFGNGRVILHDLYG